MKNVHESVADACAEYCRGLPNTFDVIVNARNQGDVVEADISSDIEGVAPINVQIDKKAEVVYLLCGVHTNVEIPFSGGYYTKEACLKELAIICESVLSGGLTEDIVFSSEKPMKGRFTVENDVGVDISGVWRNLYVCPFGMKRRKLLKWLSCRLSDAPR